jgi:rhodanese-related sulfurtransferase
MLRTYPSSPITPTRRGPMPTRIIREDVQRMLGEGAQLVDPLPEGEHAEEHLSGAINVPLRELNRETTAHLRKDQPVIVYCYDLE